MSLARLPLPALHRSGADRALFCSKAATSNLSLALSCCAVLLVGCSQVPKPASDPGHSAASGLAAIRAERRTFLRTLRLHGTVEAVRSYLVSAPRLSGQSMTPMVITSLVGNGARVRKDDTLVEFDRQNQLKLVVDREAEYRNLLQQIRKKEADQAATRAREETRIKEAEYDLQAARVDMRKNEVVTSIEAEKNTQNLAEAEARLAQLRETLKLRRDAAAAELRILEIQRDRALNAMNYAQRNTERMTIVSPLDGMVVLTPIFKMSKMADPQEGDEVRPGQSLLMVVDPTAMQVRARVNQIDFYQLSDGQSTEIRLDAYPDLKFSGSIRELGAVGTAGDFSRSQLRFFVARVSIEESDPRLLPDLSAAVDVQIEKVENVLVLPRECLITGDSGTSVEVLAGSRTELRPVKIGTMNDCEVVVKSGLKSGEMVARVPGPVGPPSDLK